MNLNTETHLQIIFFIQPFKYRRSCPMRRLLFWSQDPFPRVVYELMYAPYFLFTALFLDEPPLPLPLPSLEPAR